MALALDRPEIAQLHARLAPYARGLLDRCGAYALQMHADEVGPEHLLSTLMEDEECGAHHVALHAFADPPTISEEARALASGILISGSAATLPFSAFGVHALRGARSVAVRRRDARIEIAHLLLAAFERLDPDLRATLADAGWSPGAIEELLGAGGTGAIAESGHLFAAFSDDAKRALSAAAKLARAERASSISAAHLFLAAIQAESRFERAAGLPASRARIALRGRTLDTSTVEGGPLAPDDSLVRFLAALPAGADSVELLLQFHRSSATELARVLLRHKVTPALIERARGAIADPA